MTPTTTRQTWFSSARLTLGGLLLLALVVRGGVLWTMQENLDQDPDAYREIAENLLRHGEFALGKGKSVGGEQPFHPTAYRPPLYPVLLSNLPTADGHQVSLAKVAILHLVLGVASVWLTWLTARRLMAMSVGPEARQEVALTGRSGLADDAKNESAEAGGPAPVGAEGTGPPGLGERLINEPSPTLRSGLLPYGPPGLNLSSLLAGLIVALDPILLNQQSLLMTETLAAFLAILSLWCLARFDAERSWFNAGLAGGAIGLAVLSRPTFLPWLGMVGLTMLVVRGGLDFRFWILDFGLQKKDGAKARQWFSGFGWRLANLAALGIVAAGVMSPWAIRNYRVFRKPIVTTSHGGYTLRLGNNPQFYEWLRTSNDGLPWDNSKFQSTEDEAIHITSPGTPIDLFWDAWWYRRAIQTITTQPYGFIYASFYRLSQLWSPLPHKLTADESTNRRLLRYVTCLWYCGVYMLAAIGIWRLRWKLLAPPWVWGVLLCLAFTAVHTFYWSNLRMRAPLMPFAAIVAAQGLFVSRQR